MSGCFGDSKEDKWKESLSVDQYEMESDEDSKISCEWCSNEYIESDSSARDPEIYCSPCCRMLHMEYSDDDKSGALGDGEL